MPFSSRLLTLLALAIYFCWGIVFILQKPGLQEDEALVVLNAIHIDLKLHGGDPAVTKPSGWVALPLMSADYVGAIKDYLTVPFIELFGVRTSAIRVVSLLLGALGIWGIAVLVGQQVSPAAGFAAALILAIHPSYLNMVVFDNNAIATMMAGLGLLCAALAYYLRCRTPRAAFMLGAACGFAIWARANFVWTEVALGVALLAVYRREALAHLAKWKPFVYGALLGGAPFLLYQVLSGGATWRAQQVLQAKAPIAALFSYRIFLLAETLLCEGEHRKMWEIAALPPWQMWLFPAAIAAAVIVCLFTKGRGVGRVAAVALLVNALILFTSRLQVAEHHLFVLVPLAVIVAVVACHNLNMQFESARWGIAALALVYAGSAMVWNIETARGLHRTGGKGDWSDAMTSLANYLDHRPAGEVIPLDWGVDRPLYVLTRGRQIDRELYWGDEPLVTNWKAIIDAGGAFVLSAPQNRHFPAAAKAFLSAIEKYHPVLHRQSFFERDGTPFAEVIEIEPATKAAAPPSE